MKNNIFNILLLSITVLFAGCGNKLEDKKQVTITSGKVSPGVEVGKKLQDYTFNDQFDKVHMLTKNTKKVIFVFTKATGHLVKSYLKQQEDTYLQNRNIDFIADVSGMPSIIYKMFALPDFKKSNYKVLLIQDEKKSALFRNDKQLDAVMIITLDNKIVKDVKFITNEKDLIKSID